VTIRAKLLLRVIKEFPWVEEGAVLERRTPSAAQREAGACLWILPDYDIWSVFTMKQCVEATSWYVAEGEHHFEVIPEN
jgi:hypothetical protein